MVLSWNREALPTETVSNRQTSANLPVVARVESILLPPHGVRITKLISLACGAWQSEQKGSPGIECVRARDTCACSRLSADVVRGDCIAGLQRCGRAAELE